MSKERNGESAPFFATRRVALLRKLLSRPGSVAAVLLSGLGLTACQTLPPPPPPPPPFMDSVPDQDLLRDWRGAIVARDMDRYQRLDEAWQLALKQAREQPGSGRLNDLGRLITPQAALDDVTPPEGQYRCRTVKLGSQMGAEGLGYVVYGWFACRIERTSAGLKLTKLTGSQRPVGLLFPENDQRMVFLGSMALASEAAPRSYGERPDRDMVAVLERIGERRWRLVVPWPHAESHLDLIELVPASR